MAAYTSTQSGDFSAAATWGGGGYPSANGDTFTVSAGHTVTIDTNSPVSTGFDNSYVYGTLIHETGIQTSIRMNGILYVKSGGRYEMVPQSDHIIYGGSTAHHCIWIENENDCDFVAKGSAGNTQTTLTGDVTVGATSISVTSASGFGVGDWISIFGRGLSYSDHVDEGMWIHDISGTTIYVREFVGPSSDIVEVIGTDKIRVVNAKVFRVGHKLIFGTGANRNVSTITAIDYLRNVITLADAVSGTVVDETVYTTGLLKPHASSNSLVQKVAMTVTAEQSASANTLTLSSVDKLSNGVQVIVMDSEENLSNTEDQVLTVDSVNGNVVTFQESLADPQHIGDTVSILTRDCRIYTDDGQYGGIYSEYYTSNYNKLFIMQDVEMSGFGCTDSLYYGACVIRGYHTYSTGENSQSRLDSCTLHSPRYARDWTGLTLYSNVHQFVIRNCVSSKYHSGIAKTGGNHNRLFNSIVYGGTSRALRWEGMYSSHSEMSYNWFHRGDTNYIYYWTAATRGIFMNYFTNNNGYGLYIMRSYPHYIWRCVFKNNSWRPSGYAVPRIDYVDCLFDYYLESDTVKRVAGSGSSGFYIGGTQDAMHHSYEHNFEYDNGEEWSFQVWRKWDTSEGAWRVHRRADDGTNECGFSNTVFVPANTTFKAKATIKLPANFSGEYPTLKVNDLQDNEYHGADLGGSWATRPAGGTMGSQFTVAAVDAWESKEVTLAPKPWGRLVLFGVISTNYNAGEGWWERPIRHVLDPPDRTGIKQDSYLPSARKGRIGTNFNAGKRRIGGRI